MAKLIVLAYIDIAVSDQIDGDPPYSRIAEVDSELEKIIKDGCAEQCFSYVRPPDIVGDAFSDDVYELTED